MQATTRQYWGKNTTNLPELNLTQLQIDSYQEFLASGIRESLEEINSEDGIQDFTGKTGL
jgi:DNA-directed RNA polymerase beta subunit